MTGKLHRALVLLTGVIVKVGTIVVITDPSALGVSGDTWAIAGAWLALAGSVLADIATLLRADAFPNWSTGIGNEQQGVVKTTTLETKTEVTP